MFTAPPWSALTGLTGGQFYFVNRTADGTAATATLGTATFATVLQHLDVRDGVTPCSLVIVDETRARDDGLRPNNAIVAQTQWGWRDPIVCPVCGLSGTIDRRRWTAS